MNIGEVLGKFNIDTFGVCDASLYNEATGRDYKVCIVALFPYFCGYPDDYNLSIYSHGMDYHRVIRDILSSAAQLMELEDYDVQADTGPLIDRLLALKAGLCFRGRNGMCINERYGSYFFIGYIACNIEAELSVPLGGECMGCNRCIEACPGKALDRGFCEENCLSAITQKKGELSEHEISLVSGSALAFGCDICQRVCPHNREAEHTPIKQFTHNLVVHLDEEELSSMSNREFVKKYGDRAFAWRGKKVIERNLRIQKNTK